MTPERTTKKNAISNILSMCRSKKQGHNVGDPMVGAKYEFNLKNENWDVTIVITSDNRVNTQFNRRSGKFYTQYPWTAWGGHGKRWDSELKEFMQREFEKE